MIDASTDAVAQAAELLGVDVHQFASMLPLVAAHRLAQARLALQTQAANRAMDAGASVTRPLPSGTVVGG